MSEEHQNISRENLCSSDFLASFLIDKFHLSPFLFALFVPFLGSCLAILIASLTGSLYIKEPKPNNFGLFNDWIPWVMILIANPCIAWSYLWSYQAIDDLLEGLKSSQIITINESNINGSISNLYSKQWRKFIALLIAAISSICVFTFLKYNESSWGGSHLLPRIKIAIDTLIVIYMAVIFLLNLVNNLLILHSIFTKKDIDINPLHPDGCGGLRFLSKYSLKMAYISIILAFWFGAIQSQIWTDKNNDIYVTLLLSFLLFMIYFIGSTLFVFSPRWIVYKEIKKQINTRKNKLLNRISDEFKQISSDIENLQEHKEKINELTILYNTIDKFSPLFFDIKYLRLYFSTLPLLSIFGLLLPPLIEQLPAIIKFINKGFTNG